MKTIDRSGEVHYHDEEYFPLESPKKGGKLNLLRFGFVALFLLFVFLGLVYSVRG